MTGNGITKTHDEAGTAKDDTIAYTYNERDELTVSNSTLNGETRFIYDDNGSTKTSTHNNVTETSEYDLQNRLVRIDHTSDGTWDVIYTYDGNNTRVAETVDVLFVGASAEQMSSSRATAGVLGGGLFGLIFGASIEAMSREMYLRSSGLIIRQTAFRRVRVFPKQWIQIRRGVARKGFQRIEICGHNDSKQTVAMWITLKDADRLESWLNSS